MRSEGDGFTDEAGHDQHLPDADMALVEFKDAPSARVPLDRDRVVAAALRFIRRDGLAGLTMRRLGKDLGVEAMALYRYVPGKEDLLDAVVDELTDGLRADPEVSREPEHGWQDFLQRLAHGTRRIALSNPNAFPLIASRPAEAPWLRPPLRTLEWVQLFLAGMLDEGFSESAAVTAYRAFSSFLLGHLLLEVASLGADVGPLDVIEEDIDDPENVEGEYPLVHRLRPQLSQNHSATEFEEALNSLLSRLALLLVD